MIVYFEKKLLNTTEIVQIYNLPDISGLPLFDSKKLPWMTSSSLIIKGRLYVYGSALDAYQT